MAEHPEPREPMELRICMGEEGREKLVQERLSQHIAHCPPGATCRDRVCEYVSWFQQHYNQCLQQECRSCPKYRHWMECHAKNCHYTTGCVLPLCQELKTTELRRMFRYQSQDAPEALMEREDVKTLDEAYICPKLACLTKTPSIVEYFGAAMLPSHPSTIQLFLELMPTCLQGYTFKCGPLSLEKIHHAYQLIDAVDFLHNKLKIVHCDIKPTNLLINHNVQRLKVADFGCAELLEECHLGTSFPASAKAGTLAYNPPEHYREKQCSFAFDIWQAGCSVLAMRTGKRPWHRLFMDFIDRCERTRYMKNHYRHMEPETVVCTIKSNVPLLASTPPNWQVHLIDNPGIGDTPGTGELNSHVAKQAKVSLRSSPAYVFTTTYDELQSAENANFIEFLREHDRGSKGTIGRHMVLEQHTGIPFSHSLLNKQLSPFIYRDLIIYHNLLTVIHHLPYYCG